MEKASVTQIVLHYANMPNLMQHKIKFTVITIQASKRDLSIIKGQRSFDTKQHAGWLCYTIKNPLYVSPID